MHFYIVDVSTMSPKIIYFYDLSRTRNERMSYTNDSVSMQRANKSVNTFNGADESFHMIR